MNGLSVVFAMQNPYLFCFHMFLVMCFCVDPLTGFNATAAKANVGVILDLDTALGKICRTCIAMAIEDFYSNRDYNTMIEPHFRDSRSDVVTAASAGILTLTQILQISNKIIGVLDCLTFIKLRSSLWESFLFLVWI